MVTVHNLLTNEVFYGEDLEYFIDDDTQIGEVYLDGDLIYQFVEELIMDESDLEIEFNRVFEVREEKPWNDDFSNDDEDEFDY